MLPFSSSPLSGRGNRFPKILLDGCMDISDISDTFQKNFVLNEELDSSIDAFKKTEMRRTVKQLSGIQRIIFPHSCNNAINGAGAAGLTLNEKMQAETPLLTSLGITLALLEPAQINSASVTTAISVRTHRILEKQRMLADIKAQTTELKEKKESINTTVKDIRSEIEAIKKKVNQYEQEMNSMDEDELRIVNATYLAEIAAERERFEQAEALETACSKEKIDSAMSEVKNLQKKAEMLSSELEYAASLPPNLRQIRSKVEERKRHLQDIIHKVEDLMEYGFKH